MGWTIFPGSPLGEVLEPALGVEVEAELALELAFGFCAQGGRSGLSWLNATVARSSAGTARSKVEWGRKGVMGFGS